jgi:hypothetical protein
MIMRQTLPEAVGGHWDGGPKKQFDWMIQGIRHSDKDGEYIKVGSWEANQWYNVAVGKTERATLANARRRMPAELRKKSTFEYIDDGRIGTSCEGGYHKNCGYIFCGCTCHVDDGMEGCADCKKRIYAREVVDDCDDKLCMKCARIRYPNEEAFMTPEEIIVGHYLPE